MTTRAAETRAAQAYAPYKEVSDLTLPESVLEALAAEGNGYLWVRHELEGQPDTKNLLMHERDGWTFVTRSWAEENGWKNPPSVDLGRWGDVVNVGDLVLAKQDLDLIKRRDDYFQDKARKLESSIMFQMQENQRAARLLPLVNESHSTVRRGGPRKVEFDAPE